MMQITSTFGSILDAIQHPADTSLVFLASETPFPVNIVCLSIYDIFIVEKDSHVPQTPLIARCFRPGGNVAEACTPGFA